MRTRPAGFEPSDTSIFAALAEPMARVLLDTTVLIDVLRGRPAAARLGSLRGQQDVPFVCALNVEEVIRGLRPGEEAGARRLFNGMLVAPLGRPEGELAGRWRRKYAARSVTLSQADCLVAAAAVGVGARLATGNAKDYPMPELVIEHWPVGRKGFGWATKGGIKIIRKPYGENEGDIWTGTGSEVANRLPAGQVLIHEIINGEDSVYVTEDPEIIERARKGDELR